ncbi:MAG TPA: hypothetical protein VJ723_00480 [Candidatus Angelobacter sp.]|nr:hypothetical protein [Candidatus Angelobacter sp.]
MAASGLGIGTPLGNDPQAVFQARIDLAKAKIKRNASWFDLIAVFSVVNSVILLANGGWHFLIGLGITEVITVLSREGQGAVIGLVLAVIVAAFFWGMGHLTKKGQMWALILGIIFYVLDAGILIWLQDWLSVAFHAYALFRLSQAFSGIKDLETAQQAAQTSGLFPVQPIG